MYNIEIKICKIQTKTLNFQISLSKVQNIIILFYIKTIITSVIIIGAWHTHVIKNRPIIQYGLRFQDRRTCLFRTDEKILFLTKCCRLILVCSEIIRYSALFNSIKIPRRNNILCMYIQLLT